MTQEQIIQKDSMGTVLRTMHQDRGLVVGYTRGRVTFQINSGSFNERALYEMYHRENHTPSQTEKDQAIFERLMRKREELGLEPDATMDGCGKGLRELIGVLPSVNSKFL